MSAPATVDLGAVFCQNGQKIAAVQEVSMSANQKITDVHHWQWNRRGDSVRTQTSEHFCALLAARFSHHLPCFQA